MMTWQITKPDLPFPCSQKLYSFWKRNQEKIENEDTQVIGILYGRPGSGKSVRAQQAAYIGCADKITMQQIAFDKPDLITAVLCSNKIIVIADEGISIFHSRAAMTKEGRLMAELMAQTRQRNLHLIICIRDLLEVDSAILRDCNYVAHVWESRLNGTTIKGNMKLYPAFKSNNYKDRWVQYMRLRRSNPILKLKTPAAWLTEAGQPYGEGHKPAFYAVPEAEYKAKKESVLNKYRHALERKPRNNRPDYSTMDKLIKARVVQTEIAKHLNVSIATVRIRAAMLRGDKSNKKKPKHRR